MSKTKLGEQVKLRVWVRAGGRCQYPGCNQALWRDDLTLREMNRSYLAHIVSDSPDGPRGNCGLSEQLKGDPSNIMLLCDAHHRLVDKEDVGGHPADLLRKYKNDHEARIERQTATQANMRTHIVMFGARIGRRDAPVSYQQALDAVRPERYSALEHGIRIDLNDIEINEDDPEFWGISAKHLQRSLRARLKDGLGGPPINHLSIFGLAPIPLLIKFGEILGDTVSADVFQRHRETKDWRWKHLADESFRYIVTMPRKRRGLDKVAVNLSLSGTIHRDEIEAAMAGRFPVYSITHGRPELDFLRSKEQLELFRMEWRSLLAEIRRRHGAKCEVHLFPAVPCSVAVELGMSVLPKVGPVMHVYDKRDGLFRYVLTVPGEGTDNEKR